MPWPKTPPLRLVPTARFSVFAPAFPIAKDGAVVLDEDFYSAAGHGPVCDLGMGDSALLLDLVGDGEGAQALFEEVGLWANCDQECFQCFSSTVGFSSGFLSQVRDEIHWREMMHKGGPVPRLVSIQGTFVFNPSAADGSGSGRPLEAVAEPVYRHPADAQPRLGAWTPAVLRAKAAAEAALGGQELNHGLVQYYRNGDDCISEHGAKRHNLARARPFETCAHQGPLL